MSKAPRSDKGEAASALPKQSASKPPASGSGPAAQPAPKRQAPIPAASKSAAPKPSVAKQAGPKAPASKPAVPKPAAPKQWAAKPAAAKRPAFSAPSAAPKPPLAGPITAQTPPTAPLTAQTAPVGPPTGSISVPASVMRQWRLKKLRARKVRRLIRHVEPWSVLKISLVFYFCLWVVLLIAGGILWSLAVSSGMVGNLENFVTELAALERFELNGDQIFRAVAIGGLVLVVVAAGFTVLMAVLFNLISDIIGGIRVTVVEEETARFRPRRLRIRRPARPAPPVAPVARPPGPAPGPIPPRGVAAQRSRR